MAITTSLDRGLTNCIACGVAHPPPVCGGAHGLTKERLLALTQVLARAVEATQRDRQGAYGHPADHFGRTVAGLNARFLSGKNPLFRRPMQPQEWALAMVIDKVIGRGDDTLDKALDDLVDAAGYSETYKMVTTEIARRGREGETK